MFYCLCECGKVINRWLLIINVSPRSLQLIFNVIECWFNQFYSVAVDLDDIENSDWILMKIVAPPPSHIRSLLLLHVSYHNIPHPPISTIFLFISIQVLCWWLSGNHCLSHLIIEYSSTDKFSFPFLQRMLSDKLLLNSTNAFKLHVNRFFVLHGFPILLSLHMSFMHLK